MSNRQTRKAIGAEALKYMLGTLFGASGAMALIVLTNIQSFLCSKLAQLASPERLAQTSVILVAMTILSWVLTFLIFRRPEKPLWAGMKFDAKGGFFVDPKTGCAMCPSCMKGKSLVPMQEAHEKARKCQACGQIFAIAQ